MDRERPGLQEEMKPAVDEMFPEGAGPYVDLDEVRRAAPGGRRSQGLLSGAPGPRREEEAACAARSRSPRFLPLTGELGPGCQRPGLR